MKKLLFRAVLSIGTLGVIVSGAAAFSAFEAHIINVTARIENATGVNVTEIGFGTVFPQEEIDKIAVISLSDSFKDQTRVNTVTYTIKQKPKVKDPTSPIENPRPGNPYSVITVDTLPAMPAWQYCETQLPVGSPYTFNPANPYWTNCYIPLANYLSKHSSKGSADTEVAAFHKAYKWVNDQLPSALDPQYIAGGTLVNSLIGSSTTWTFDLKVPCFVNQCDQGWDAFVQEINPGANSSAFILSTTTEHKVFGTDLWFEVTGITTS